MYSRLDTESETDVHKGEDYEQLLPQSQNGGNLVSPPRTHWVLVFIIFLITIPLSVGFGAWMATPRGGWDKFAMQRVQAYCMFSLQGYR